MSAVQQLKYVEKYFEKYAGALDQLEDVYMAVLWPRAVRKPLDYILFSSPSKAYFQNKSLDLDGDGHVTKAEATHHVRRALSDGMAPANFG